MLKQSLLPLVLSFSVSLLPLQAMAINPTNSINDGRMIQGGTYYNTTDSQTKFVNSGSGGLWLKSGTTMRGLEVDNAGNLTNNGGTVLFSAPNNVIRIDGTIDINSVRNAQGAYLGSGGKVFLDAAYLFQNGNIFANGLNGGLVQANVGAMTMTEGAHIEAKGYGGNGGVVAINSSGPVELRRTAIIDTSGRVTGSFDNNVINIEGSLINLEGLLKANGVSPVYGGSRGGTIRLVASGQTDINLIKDALHNTNQNGTSSISDPSFSTADQTNVLNRLNYLKTSQEGNIHIQSSVLMPGENWGAVISANGTSQQIDPGNGKLIGGAADPNNDYMANSQFKNRAGDGGTIIITAANAIQNYGHIRANGGDGADGTSSQNNISAVSPVNGGNGGTIALLANGVNTQDSSDILNHGGLIETNGGKAGNNAALQDYNTTGGNGGLLAFSYNHGLENTGNIRANGNMGSYPHGHGGNGGLIVFSGDSNPHTQFTSEQGFVDANGGLASPNNMDGGGLAGTIVSPNPDLFSLSHSATQMGYRNGVNYFMPLQEQTQSMELLTHAENLISLTRNMPTGAVPVNFFQRLTQSKIRSVDFPYTMNNTLYNEVVSKNTATSPYVYRNLIIASSRDNLKLSLVHPYTGERAFEEYYPLLPSPLSKGQGFSTLNTLTIANDGPVETLYITNNFPLDYRAPYYDIWSIGHSAPNFGGGRISLLANGDVLNVNLFGTNGTASGGSVNIASTGNVTNGTTYEIGNLFVNGQIHNGSIIVKANGNIANSGSFLGGFPSEIHANGARLGGTIQLISGGQFQNGNADGAGLVTADGASQPGTIVIRNGVH